MSLILSQRPRRFNFTGFLGLDLSCCYQMLRASANKMSTIDSPTYELTNERCLGAMVARRIPVPKVGGSTPSGSTFLTGDISMCGVCHLRNPKQSAQRPFPKSDGKTCANVQRVS